MTLWVLLAACAWRTAPPPARVGAAALPASARASTWHLRALAAEQRGDPEAAERALRWMVRLSGDAASWAHLAAHQLANGQADAAAAAASRACARDPLHPGANRVRGLLAARRDNPAGLAWLELAGELPGVRGAHARLLAALEGPEAGLGLLAKAPAAFGHEAVDRAKVAADLGDARLGLRLLRPALDAAGTPPEAVGLATELGRQACDLRLAYRWLRDHPTTRRLPEWRTTTVAAASATGAEVWAEEALGHHPDAVALVRWWWGVRRYEAAEAWLQAYGGSSLTVRRWRAALEGQRRLEAGDRQGALDVTEDHRGHPAVDEVRARAGAADGVAAGPPSDPCEAAGLAADAAADPSPCRAVPRWEAALRARPGEISWRRALREARSACSAESTDG